MLIPYQELEQTTLDAICREFVLREGTDYGVEEVSLEQKIGQIKQQLKLGEVVIVYSELHETVNLISKSEFAQNQFNADAE